MIQIAGVAIALVGGYVISRTDRTAKPEIPPETPSGEVPTGEVAEVPPAAFQMCR